MSFDSCAAVIVGIRSITTPWTTVRSATTAVEDRAPPGSRAGRRGSTCPGSRRRSRARGDGLVARAPPRLMGLGRKSSAPGTPPALLGVEVSQGGDQDDRNVLGGGVALEGSRHVVTVHSRHHDVQEDQVRVGPPPQRSRAPRCRWRRSRKKALPSEDDGQHLGVLAVVVHDQKACWTAGDAGVHVRQLSRAATLRALRRSLRRSSSRLL